MHIGRCPAGVELVLFEAPEGETSERVRYVIDQLLFIVTGALVSHRTDAKRDDQVLS
jgi:hypothetical protein